MNKNELEYELSKMLILLREKKNFKGGVRPADPIDEASELLEKIIKDLKKERTI